ncbi:hypothetical protein B0T09DRAFT_161397 [Sordaria sp. MPI-SDFR-AT-0083]|nr:hypothetical protein B0T09DRAFT_161397 [Sordaria sp. MPI-SDFR-AT-0083]
MTMLRRRDFDTATVIPSRYLHPWIIGISVLGFSPEHGFSGAYKTIWTPATLQTAAALDGGAVARVFFAINVSGCLISFFIFLFCSRFERLVWRDALYHGPGNFTGFGKKKKSDSRFWRLCV